MNFALLDDDDVTQLEFSDLTRSSLSSSNTATDSRFANQIFAINNMGRYDKRASSCDIDTEDSGFGSNLSPPFAKCIKLDSDDSRSCLSTSSTTANSWTFGQLAESRRQAFTVNNENMSLGQINLFSGKYSSRSRDGRVEIKLLSQPEEQHRARYMTEGSRGAIKDRTGLSHPVVKLVGINYPVKVDCFIGHDKHLGLPHLFYQASRINGKNSTKCSATKIEGTTVISFDILPEMNMSATVDCVGILKERNVDVEHKLQRLKNKGELFALTKKRSTKCRLVFRCQLPDTKEVLMTVSSPILCTQPAGCPEVAKKSCSEADVNGGQELFMIGKNFVKDSKVVWKGHNWIKVVDPNKEFLHSTHMICVVPAYDGQENQDVIHVSLFVKNSDGKTSESHTFVYTRNVAAGSRETISLSSGEHGLPHKILAQTMASPLMPCEVSSLGMANSMSSYGDRVIADQVVFKTESMDMPPPATIPSNSNGMKTLDSVFYSLNEPSVQDVFNSLPNQPQSGVNCTQTMFDATTPSTNSMTFSHECSFINVQDSVSSCLSIPSTVTTSNPFQNDTNTIGTFVSLQENCTLDKKLSQVDHGLVNQTSNQQPTNQTYQTSINVLSQMTDTELLGLINPSTFEQVM